MSLCGLRAGYLGRNRSLAAGRRSYGNRGGPGAGGEEVEVADRVIGTIEYTARRAGSVPLVSAAGAAVGVLDGMIDLSWATFRLPALIGCVGSGGSAHFWGH